MKNQRKLRNYFLDKRFLANHAGTMLFMQILVALAVALMTSWFYLILLDNHLVCNHNTTALWHLGSGVMVIVLLGMFWSIRYTHSITGPVYKMGNVLNAAAAGTLPRKQISFRKGDRLIAMEKGLNGCLQCMREHQQEREEIISLLESTMKSLRAEELTSREGADFMESMIRKIRTSSER